ncbi:MAG: MFS transporter [Thermoplasmata archaeon]|jgi:MFS family permease|nr:MFS transporter [Thermoplasmatales archaeon]
MTRIKIDRILIDTTIAHFINDGLSYLPFFLIIMIKENYNLSFFAESMILMSYYIGSAIVSPYMGRYIDRTRKKGLFMGIGMFLFSLSFLLLVPPYPQYIAIPSFMFSMFIISIFSTIYHPIGSMILNYRYRDYAGTVLGINGIGGSLGRALFPVIMEGFLAAFNKNFVFSIISISFIMGAISLYVAYDMRKEEIYVEKKIKRGVFRFSLPIAFFLVATILRNTAIQGGFNLLPAFLNSTLHYSSFLIAIILFIANSTAIVGQPFLGYLSDRYGGKTMLIVTSLIPGILLILLMFVSNVYTVSIIFIVTYFFGMSNFPLLMVFVGELSSDEELAENSAVIFGLGGGIGGALGSIAIGVLAQTLNIYLAFIIIGVISIAGSLMMFYIPKKS